MPGWAGPQKNVCKVVWREKNKQTKKPLTATVCKYLSLEVLDSPQELLLWSIFMGPVQCDENTECSGGICKLELEVAQQPWHRPSRAEGPPGSISAAQGTWVWNPQAPGQCHHITAVPSTARAAAGGAGREGSSCTWEAQQGCAWVSLAHYSRKWILSPAWEGNSHKPEARDVMTSKEYSVLYRPSCLKILACCRNYPFNHFTSKDGNPYYLLPVHYVNLGGTIHKQTNPAQSISF